MNSKHSLQKKLMFFLKSTCGAVTTVYVGTISAVLSVFTENSKILFVKGARAHFPNSGW